MELSKLEIGKTARIVKLEGGHGLKRNLRIKGIREGKNIKIITRQPIGGPLVVEVEGMQTVIGRGMAKKIFVEE
ncbi:MAG: ferrous iron transport protein A [Thermoplasmatales archaeon]|nr:ferrous iron transport protein A [Candidatus Thermoplasmatota archaeon]MCG2825665.1 ferrous iron transport protein A [Thermoplasmatales archaeon]